MRFVVSVVIALGLSIAGCSTGTSPNPPGPPTPPAPPATPSIVVTSPTDGSNILGEPVKITITTANLSDTSKLSLLLNGKDITSRLGAADTNGNQSIQVQQPDIYYGKNQVQLRYNDLRASASFKLVPGSGVGSTNTADPNAQLIPIQTRVLVSPNADMTKPTNWSIVVGGTPYASPMPVDQNGKQCSSSCYGYQILLLNRQDPSVKVSNDAYEVDNENEILPNSAFMNALEKISQGPQTQSPQPISGCGKTGCIVVIQSLGAMGYTPCYGQNPCGPFDKDEYVKNWVQVMTKLGASGQMFLANGMSPQVGYSFIGNGGSGAVPWYGTQGDGHGNVTVPGNALGQFEHMSCSNPPEMGSEICDSLGYGGIAGTAPDQAHTGQISGVLIRDNYNLFTFAQSAPTITYTFGTTKSGNTYTNVVSINGSTAEKQGQYTQTINGAGFRMLILDREHPDSPTAAIWDKVYSYPSEIGDIDIDIRKFPRTNGLFFFAAVGDIRHSNEDPNFSSTWALFVEDIKHIGGEPMTLTILGDNHKAFDPDGLDDYLLVGKQIPNVAPAFDNFTAGMQSHFTAQESGYVINRHTLANATSPTQVEGTLVMDHQGYYTPRMQGLQAGMAVPQVAAMTHASLLAPVPWPFSSTSSQQNAYQWVSQKLCTCDAIRLLYTDLNVSPSIWYTQVQQLVYPSDRSDSTKPNYIAPSDFADVQAQLATEFNYLALVRNLQSNIIGLYQSQQSNVGLILDQAASDIKADVEVDNPPKLQPTPWSTFTQDVFPILSNFVGFVGPKPANIAKTAMSIGTMIIDDETEKSNDPSGVSQAMHALANEEVAEADLAQHITNQYTDTLATLGNDFKRVVTDWGRLSAVAGPIATGQLVWDPTASSTFLRAFDMATRRQFYPALMRNNPNFFVTHIRYGDTQYYGRNDHFVWGNDEGCPQEHFHEAQDNLTGYDNNGQDLRGTAWWPGYQQSQHNPRAYWWDIWALGLGPETNDHCPYPTVSSIPNTYGMFDPITSDDLYQTGGLGLWKPYILQYRWTPLLDFNKYYDGSAP